MVKMEWNHNFRAYFFYMPHLTMMFMILGIPDDFDDTTRTKKIFFLVTFPFQLFLSIERYRRWMYLKDRSMKDANTTFLLSLVGWLLLCIICQQAKVREDWGIDLPQFFFGIGVFYYCLVITSIL